jgi:hypothetical protein
MFPTNLAKNVQQIIVRNVLIINVKFVVVITVFLKMPKELNTVRNVQLVAKNVTKSKVNVKNVISTILEIISIHFALPKDQTA